MEPLIVVNRDSDHPGEVDLMVTRLSGLTTPRGKIPRRLVIAYGPLLALA